MKESHKRLKEVYDKGYRVNSEGEVISPKTGRARKLQLRRDKHRGNYYRFGMKMNGKSYPVPVHRLAAYQKFGDKMFTADTVRHLDGDSTNNRLENLDTGSHSDNAFDRDEEARKQHAIKAAMKRRSLDEDAIRFIRSSNCEYAELCAKYGVVKSTISAVKNRKIYKSVLDKA